MQTSEFWEEEPELLWAYRKSYIDKMKLEREMMNHKAWINGLYVFDAVSVSLYNAFAKTGTEPKNYVKEPFDFNMTKEEFEIKRRREMENNIRKSLNRKKELLKQGEKI